MIKTFYPMMTMTLVFLPMSILLAQDQSQEEESRWKHEIQLGAELEPAYTGSDEYNLEPDLDFRSTYTSNSGRQYYFSLGEIGVRFPFGENMLFVTALEYEPGRDNDDDPILTFFPEQEDTLEAQFTLARRWRNWTFAGIIQPDILDRGKGLVYFLGLNYEQELSDKLKINYSADASFSDKEHANTEVGIAPAVATSSGLPEFAPSSGYKSTSLAAEFAYEISNKWTALFETELEFYGGNFSDSPLIKSEGDDVNYEIAIGVKFTF